MNILIKCHKTGGLEFIKNTKDLPAHEIVEAWQKKQTDYLIRERLAPCSWIAVEGGLIEAMKQSKHL